MAGTKHRPSVRHVDFEQAEGWMGRKSLKKAFRVDDQAVDEELRDARGITPSGREIYETKSVGRLLGDKARAERIRQRMALKSVELRRSRQIREFRKAEQRRRNQARRRSWRRDAAENVQDYVLDHTHQTRKFDGRGERLLTDLEIRQIAGRAGRYGMYAEGEVTAVTDSDLRRLDEALNGLPPEPCDHAYRSFDLALGMDERWSLSLIMRCWRETDQGSPFLWTQDIETPLRAAAWMERLPWEGGMPRDLECAMAFLPFDWNDPDLRDAFRAAVRALMDGGDMTWLAVQDADRTKLKSLERGLKILSFRFAFARATGLMDDDMLTGFDAMRRQLEEALITLLDGPKSMQLAGFR